MITKLSSSEQAVQETLDMLIAEEAWDIAQNVLDGVQSTFPLYDEYEDILSRLHI